MKVEELNTISLNTSELCIGYREGKNNHILHERLNLTIHAGDLVCLIGPNGSGKSTLVRTLGGLQPLIKGRIHICNQDLIKLTHTQRSKLLSTVLTDKTAIDNITVEEIVMLGRYADTNWLGTMNEDDLQIVKSSLIEVGMDGFGDRYYGTLSDGEKQRAFIAKALATKAPLMLLDEPTAHLDIPNRVEIMTLLRRLTREENRSILVSTHDLDLALQLADEIWLMEKDNITLCTTPEEAISSGIINDCFGSAMVEFHADYGRFIIKSKPIAFVSVTGKGINFELTRKGLERNGFSTNSNEAEISIHVEKQNWKLETAAFSFKSNRLSEILRIVRNLNR